jgi:hypothetical protein
MTVVVMMMGKEESGRNECAPVGVVLVTGSSLYIALLFPL